MTDERSRRAARMLALCESFQNERRERTMKADKQNRHEIKNDEKIRRKTEWQQ